MARKKDIVPKGTVEERLERFLVELGKDADLGRALVATGLSLNAVTYRRKRDPEFAAGWELAFERAGKARDHLVFLDVFSKTGNQTEALRLSGMKRTELLARKRDDPEFAEAFADAQAVANDALEAEARRRAVEGVDDLVVQSGYVVYMTDESGKVLLDEIGQPIPVKKKVYSDKLLETLLKANMPEKYRENVKVDHAVTGGVLLLAGKAPSEDDWEKRMEQKRLERAGRVIEHGAS